MKMPGKKTVSLEDLRSRGWNLQGEPSAETEEPKGHNGFISEKALQKSKQPLQNDQFAEDGDFPTNLPASLNESGLGNPSLRSTDMEGQGKATPKTQDNHPQSRRDSAIAEAAMPRPSVQFARPPLASDVSANSHARTTSNSMVDGDFSAKDRRAGSIFTKLKAFAAPSTTQTISPNGNAPGQETMDGPFSGSYFTDPVQDESSGQVSPRRQESDADCEESAGEETLNEHHRARRTRNKRKRRSHSTHDAQTAPTTPRVTNHYSRPSFLTSASATPTDRFRPSFMPRRATMTDVQDDSRQGVSEDEGRERMHKSSHWRRGSLWVPSARGLSSMNLKRDNEHSAPEDRRPSNFRRITRLGAGAESSEAPSSSPWRTNRGEKATTVSAAKWRQLKAGLKMIGQRRKAENIVDHAKSAELLAELTAGAPAALILASMFQRDDHGNKRIPILLEQLKVRITDSKQVDSKSGDRHMIFRIEMEYGNGLTRMKWMIHRALRDFANLHVRYKVQVGTQKYIHLKGDEVRTKLPHFPRSTFPYLRGIRGLESDTEEEDDNDADGAALSGGEASGTEQSGAKRKKKHRPNLVHRRKSSVISLSGDGQARRDAYPERQRKKLEVYLQQMIRYLIFRPESNRLCKFLELSALGVRLAAEGSYHGKEGLLVIKSGKGIDFRKAWTPSLIVGRHGPKWFSVRHSYVVCVDSPEAMNIYDVFLVDADFRVANNKKSFHDQQKPKDKAKAATSSATGAQHHSLKLYNSERKLKLLAKNERQLQQFQESILFMCTNSPWAKPKRFDSFAPVRQKVFAQWLVDGRDYMWNVSRAISMAKDVIYIHDWWLSPELYMRRPAAISQKWRLDRLLQRKAREGVKVFVIMYRNINSAIPIDSEYSKFSLLDLHPNVFVQRSPNQFRQNTFFWAHHEKLCLIDHMVAFVGGIDLCFGRWDTPQHSVVDDKMTGFEQSDEPRDADHCQLWPGKDYSNPRVQDFYALDKPYEEMYDRGKVPRMPWHDIHMQIVGQPARDLTRHFVQRWNYILRQRKPTRPTPFLLPPPDLNQSDLETLGLDGTCEVQILRSACEWSLGTPGITEHSIMNAYIKMIEQSDHFVYIENQFFISSCEVEGTKVENMIGDALVERIVRAAQRKEDWRAVVVIPLMPGFQNTVDEQDGTSVRLIMQCQFRSICRGEASIFGRVRAAGIEPEDYIQFYSLRSWGKIGPSKQLVTEQLYIHAKCMIVDDRIAIIGSANINERSMLGSRDSECAAVVRDTDILKSTMNGKPYMVGRFAHTLRMRLMREHLGLDVDEVMDEEQNAARAEEERQRKQADDDGHVEPSDEETRRRIMDSTHQNQDEMLLRSENLSSFNHDIDWEQGANPNLRSGRKLTEDPRVTNKAEHRKSVEGEGHDAMKREDNAGRSGGRDTILLPVSGGQKEVLVGQKTHADVKELSTKADSPRVSQSSNAEDRDRNILLLPPDPPLAPSTSPFAPSPASLPALPNTDDTDIGGPSIQRSRSQKVHDFVNPALADLKQAAVDRDCMRDPLLDAFFLDTWHAVAENNTKLFRQVFRCMPDTEVKSWKEYKEYAAYAERFTRAHGGGISSDALQRDAPSSSGPPGAISTADKLKLLGPLGEKAGNFEAKTEAFNEKVLHRLGQKETGSHPMGRVEEWAEEANKAQAERHAKEEKEREDAGLPPPGAELLDEKVRTSNELKPSVTLVSKMDGTETSISKSQSPHSLDHSEALNRNASGQKRRRRATTRSSTRQFRASDDIIGKEEAEDLMHAVQGHLVLWPYDWLMREEQGGNWLYSIDGLAPLEI